MWKVLQVIDPVLGLIFNVAIQITACRYISRLGLLKSVYLGFAAGLFGVVSLETYICIANGSSWESLVSILLTNLIIYSALGYCYFHFINLGETARRIRILREIYDSGSGLSEDEILKRYNAGNIIEMRLNRMLSSGQVLYKENKYNIGKPILLTMSKIIVLLKLVILGQKSEFD